MFNLTKSESPAIKRTASVPNTPLRQSTDGSSDITNIHKFVNRSEIDSMDSGNSIAPLLESPLPKIPNFVAPQHARTPTLQHHSLFASHSGASLVAVHDSAASQTSGLQLLASDTSEASMLAQSGVAVSSNLVASLAVTPQDQLTITSQNEPMVHADTPQNGEASASSDSR